MMISGSQSKFAVCQTGIEAAQSGTDLTAEKLVAQSHKLIGVAQQAVQYVGVKKQGTSS